MGDGRRYVSVVGGYEVGAEVLHDAEEVGRLLAARGLVVITGGRSGVSAAASKGAYEAGGTTIGLLPGADRSEANPHLSHALATGLGETRNSLVAMNGDVVIALDGSFGTLSEIAFALLRGTPVVGLGTWALDRPSGGPDPLHRAGTPAEAVELAAELLPT